jgi:hypothetical protein
MTNAGTTTTQTTQCGRCGRTLTDPESVAAGYGPVCAKRIAEAAQASTHQPAQVAKAVELIETGGMVTVHHGRAYRAVSSDGQRTYLVAGEACNCPAGLHGRMCYHRVAVELLAMPKPRRPRVELVPADPFAVFALAA